MDIIVFVVVKSYVLEFSVVFGVIKDFINELKS